MYILGGETSPGGVIQNQMFMIDLSTSWNTASPAYKHLPDGYGDSWIPSTLLGDKKSWFMISNRTMYICNLQTMTWTNLGTSSLIPSAHGLSAAANPETGRVYIPNGYSSILGGDAMLIYETSTRSVIAGDLQPYLRKLVNYSSAWAPTLKSFLLFAGNIAGTNATKNDLYAYSPDNGWRPLAPSGTIPPGRVHACLVPAYAGRRMVMFGGIGNYPNRTDLIGPPLTDLYILDVDSMTWTRGTDADPVAGPRYGISCAVSGDYLIVWGGLDTGVPGTDTMVYNMKTAAWTTEYVASPIQASTTSLYVATPTSRGSGGGGSSNGLPSSVVGGIVGGVGAVLVAAVAAFFVLSRRKRSKDPAIPGNNDPAAPHTQHISRPPISPVSPPSTQPSYYPTTLPQHQVVSPPTSYYHSHPPSFQPTPVVSPDSHPQPVESTPVTSADLHPGPQASETIPVTSSGSEPSIATAATPAPTETSPDTVYVSSEDQDSLTAQIAQAEMIQQQYIKRFQAHLASQGSDDASPSERL
ncbi:hypothetical protein B0O80DRAFT_495152 [Mortierella sp. GBAus27b]|nr:Acyl-CoA-binding domain-containing protein 5 [Mortierella sp. GBA43]KAI8359640.1 hypothetical protein B0O80DRAFT_495152 [Mortierella sp. GBAus27b]